MSLYRKKAFKALFISLFFLFLPVVSGAVSLEKGSKEYRQSAQKDEHLYGQKKALNFLFEKIDVDTYKVTFDCNKVVNVFEMEKGCFLTVVDVSNPIKVLQFHPEIGKALPIDIGVKVQAYFDMPLELKAEKGEFIIFKYEKP
ncbi:MAG: hypothetical protein JXL81_05620 [Deltaproteobacteria bacterium]|nr:hypothetical protein [Deltaproteobacteria bacterium]